MLWITTKDPSDIEILWDPHVNFVRWYSVTYDTQWGTEIQKQKYKAWDDIILPEDPIKENYSFEWWDWEIPQKMPKENLVFTAKWKYLKWISWNGNNGWWGWWGGWWGGWWSATVDKTGVDKNSVEEQKEVKEENQNINTWTWTGEEIEINTWKNQEVDEVEEAYKWAYAHEVTTMPTLQKANPDGVVKRGHMAKMVVNFVVNVMWREDPKEIPSQCSRWDEAKERESQEIKWYAEKACALWIMWINVKTFAPNRVVTRAEFGTVLSRILRWNKYDVEKASKENPYYKKHLEALKAEWIMTQIDNPTKREEKRKRVRVMLKRVEMGG